MGSHGALRRQPLRGRRRQPRPVRGAAVITGAILGLALLAGHASAQTSIGAPAPRFISPGDYVTLVFVLHPAASGVATVRFSAPAGWRLLGAQAAVEVSAGRPAPLAVTVAVPAGGQPNSSTGVELSVKLAGATATASAELHVLPHPSIAVSAPKQVPIDAGEVTCTVTNTGNVALKLVVTFSLEGRPLASRTIDLAAQASRALTFKVSKGGSYDLTVRGPDGIATTRTITVLAYGVPASSPFTVHARVSTYVASDGSWTLDTSAVGALSDYARLSAHLSPSTPTTSYAEVAGSGWGVRLGATSNAPFDLGFPSALGLSARFGGDSWASFAGGGTVQGDQWAGYGGGAWIDGADHLLLAAAAGMSSGAPTAALSVVQKLPQRLLGARLLWLDGSLDAAAQAAAYRGQESLQLRAHVGHDAAGAPTADAYLAYAAAAAAMTASGSVDPAAARATSGLLSLSVPLPASGLGQLQLDSQLGMDTSYLALSQQADVGGWRTTNDVGVRWDQYGRAASLASSWQLDGTDYLGLDASLRIGLDGSGVRASLGARGQAALGRFLLFAGGRADGLAQTASLRTGAQWRSGGFSADLTGVLSAPYVEPVSNLSASVQLRASYDFPVTVPDGLTDLAGGLRQGTLEGRVDGAAGLSRLVVLIGPYRVRVAGDGTFTATLAPGSYRVRLDPASVPVSYRIEEPAAATVKITAKRTVDVRFRVARSAGITGAILLDSDSDGVADTPARGVPATISLVDATGAYHTTRTTSGEPAGQFVFRDLPAGTATLSVSALPLGDAVEGPSHQSVKVAAGGVSQVTFLVHPALAAAKVFGNAALVIRSLAVQAQRVPPGSSPVVTVELSGPARSVALQTMSGSLPLSGSGRAWSGRLPIPRDARTGLFTFTITARRGARTARRRGRVLVDPGVALVEAEAARAGVPGGTLPLTVTVLAGATRVELSGRPGGSIHGTLSEAAPGRWTAAVPVPAGIAPGRYALRITAFDENRVLGNTTLTVIIIARPAGGP